MYQLKLEVYTFETAVALADHTTNYTDIESLDQQVKSMMIFSENADPYKPTNPTNPNTNLMLRRAGLSMSFLSSLSLPSLSLPSLSSSGTE